MGYPVGIDIGGTFTDCAIVDRAGRLLYRNGKALTAKHVDALGQGQAVCNPPFGVSTSRWPLDEGDERCRV